MFSQASGQTAARAEAEITPNRKLRPFYAREVALVLVLCAAATCDVALGYLSPPKAGIGDVSTVARVALSLGTSFLFVLGPGITARRLARHDIPLTFVPLPGLLYMIASGSLSWALATSVGAHTVSAVAASLLIVAVAGGMLLRPRRQSIDSVDARVLIIMGLLVAVALGKTLYSVGPAGELFAGTVSRTLEVGDRPDSRVSYHVVELVDHGTHPYSTVGIQNFAPYSFSSRGPLAGLAATSEVEISGAKIPTGAFSEAPPGSSDSAGPSQRWQPFDAQGFEAYRIVMMVMAATVVLCAAGIMRAVAGQRAAIAAAALVATTPFVVHDTYFTWPKLLTAAMVLVAAHFVLRRQRLRAGISLGVAFLIHPLALFSLPALVALALILDWRTVRTARALIVLRDAALLAAGPAAALLAWRLVNGSHFAEADFFGYVTQANQYPTFTLTNWLSGRLTSTANTLVPLNLFFNDAKDLGLNVVSGTSPPIVHFFFQYWTTVPFAFGICFLPLLLLEMARVVRRAPWVFVGLIAIPFVLFDVYWGSYVSGLLREGLHAWVLTVVLVYVWSRFTFPRTRWRDWKVVDALLLGRSAEILAMLLLPVLVTARHVTTSGRHVTDLIALGLMGLGTLALAVFSVIAHRAAPDVTSAVAASGPSAR